MDLSRIEAWTREKLEAEAFRRGIRSPEFRTRAELIRLILRDQYGEQVAAGRELIALGAKSLANARGVLGNVVGAAIAALPEPLDALARLRSRLPLGRSGSRQPQVTVTGGESPVAGTWSSAPEPRSESAAAPEPKPVWQPESVTKPEFEPVTKPEPESVSDSEPESVSDSEPESVSVSEPLREPVPLAAQAETAVPASERRAGSSVPVGTFATPAALEAAAMRIAPLAPPSASARPPSTRTFVEEPIRTVSMARLLAAQGHRERALAIYEELIAQNSEDPSLQEEAQALRRGEDAQLPPLASPRGEGEEPILPDGGDRLWCEGEPAQGLRLRWELSESGQRRARAVLGRDGELAIRLVSIAFDPIRVVRSEITEHGPIDPSGEWTAPALADSARCFAAVGLRDGERFVAVVHARPRAA